MADLMIILSLSLGILSLVLAVVAIVVSFDAKKTALMTLKELRLTPTRIEQEPAPTKLVVEISQQSVTPVMAKPVELDPVPEIVDQAKQLEAEPEADYLQKMLSNPDQEDDSTDALRSLTEMSGFFKGPNSARHL